MKVICIIINTSILLDKKKKRVKFKVKNNIFTIGEFDIKIYPYVHLI